MPLHFRFARESSSAHGAVLPDFAATSGLSAVRGACSPRPDPRSSPAAAGAVLPDFAAAAWFAVDGCVRVDAASVALYAPDAVLADFVAAWWARLPLSAGASSSVASSASVISDMLSDSSAPASSSAGAAFVFRAGTSFPRGGFPPVFFRPLPTTPGPLVRAIQFRMPIVRSSSYGFFCHYVLLLLYYPQSA